MSNEVKTKEKVDMDPKYIITLTVTLFITCVIVAGLLGLVNGVTAGPIAEINLQKTQEAMLAVVADPDNTTFSESPLENTQAMTDAASAAGGTLGDIYEVQVNGEAGGYAVSFIKDRVVESAELGYEEASQAARAFMEQRGLADMQESYYVINDNICTINYAYAKDGVLYYPDLIKISVALDNGEVVEYNASGYLMNHTERKPLAPAFSLEQAQKQVSPLLKVEKGGLALIPTPGLNEVLTYEFHCTGENGDRVLVYINASTGYEEQILIIVESDEGILVR